MDNISSISSTVPYARCLGKLSRPRGVHEVVEEAFEQALANLPLKRLALINEAIEGFFGAEEAFSISDAAQYNFDLYSKKSFAPYRETSTLPPIYARYGGYISKDTQEEFPFVHPAGIIINDYVMPAITVKKYENLDYLRSAIGIASEPNFIKESLYPELYAETLNPFLTTGIVFSGEAIPVVTPSPKHAITTGIIPPSNECSLFRMSGILNWHTGKFEQVLLTGVPPQLPEALKMNQGALGTIGYFYDDKGRLTPAHEIKNYCVTGIC